MSTETYTTTETKLKLIKGHDWCTKCVNFYAKTNEFANRKQMTVVGGLYESEITLCCDKDHSFTITYQKKLTYLSCLECTRLDKLEQRQREIEEEGRRKERNRLMQERMFAQAKLAMESNSNCTQYYSGTFQRTQFAQMEQLANQRAASLARQYLKNCSTSQLTFEQCFLAYKFSQTDVEVLVSGMRNLAQSQSLTAVQAFYRKLAKQLHPDKNCHALAKEAFQTVTEAYEQVKAIDQSN